MKGYFTVFNRDIPYYGILMVCGFLIGGLLAVFRCKKYGIDKWEMVYASIFATVGGIIGAKLLSILTSINYIIEYNLSFLDVMQNGFVFYGGLIGGFIGLFIYVKVFHCDAMKYFNIFAVSVPFGHALGRIGCFLSGCCYGIELDSPISFTYTQSYDPNTPLNVPLLPIQLIESGCLFLLYIVLAILFHKCNKKSICFYTYLFAYPTIRFVLEFFRGDLIRGVYLLSTSQWISLAIILATLTYLIVTKTISYRKAKKGIT